MNDKFCGHEAQTQEGETGVNCDRVCIEVCTAYGDHYEVNGKGDHPDQHCQVQTQAQEFVEMSIAKTC